MSTTFTPLRYPGGKSCLRSMVVKILKDNGLERGSYVEPYAGGCGLALALLLKGHVHYLHLNDIDRSIWSFWNAVLNQTDELVNMIEHTEITIAEWRRQREVHFNPDQHSDLELGFSTFFLNRTNRSGIIEAGVIGGVGQNGAYKLNCRFNKDSLIDKIRRIAKYKSRIFLYNMDAYHFIRAIDGELQKKALFCIDPPYFNKGATLYTSFYSPSDHGNIAKVIQKLKKPWILTYDNTPEIKELYGGRRQYTFNLSYSAAEKRKGTELLVADDRLLISPALNISAA